MIVITGATGTVGSAVVRYLAERGEQVRAVTRVPERARVPVGVEVVRGDFTEPASMSAALAGSRALLLVSVVAPEHERAVVAAARDAGTGRVVRLSAIGTDDPALPGGAAWHAAGEQALRASGLDWTILRPSSFATNTLGWARPILADRPVPNLTGTAVQGVVDPRDVAAVAGEALRSPAHAGRTYTLTGPELLSTYDQAAVLSDVLGRPVPVVDLSEDEAREMMVAAGMPPDAVRASLAGQAWARAGRNAVVTGDIERILGRPARTFAEWAADHVRAFASQEA